MKTVSVNRLEALALIVGPVMALCFFIIEPGGMLIDSVEASDSLGRVTATASNAAMSHLTALMIPLGLIVALYGFAGLNRAIVGDETSSSLSRFGVLSLTMGGFGWIIASGLTHVIAETPVESAQALQAAIPIHETGEGITSISSMAVSLGLMAFSLGMSARDPMGFNKIAALVVFVVSIISLVALIIGYSAHSENMVTVGRLCYFPWVIWNAMLGARLLKTGELWHVSRT